MKKLLLSLMILITLSNVFAFDVLDSNGDQREYFSINDPLVKVESSENISNFSVSYNLDIQYRKYFNFTQCGEIKYGEFSLTSLIEENNNTFSGAKNFNITVSNESKLVYLDFEKPTFTLQSYGINKENRTLELNFSYFDNSNKIKSADLYEKEDSSLVHITDILNKTMHNYSISKENASLVFKIVDEANNVEEYEKFIEIGDIFPPEITSSLIVLENGKYSLEFSAEDSKLKKYEIIQGNITLSEFVSGTDISKNIDIPFNSGKIVLRFIDNEDNFAQKNFSLNSPITTSFGSLYTNKKEFSFTSNSDECYLTKFDSVSKNEKFEKSSDRFTISLNLDSEKSYGLEFYCIKEDFKEYFAKTLKYDTTQPTDTQVKAVADDNGNIKLNWEKSTDSNGVVYELYKDSDKIYSGNNENYHDDEATYPNEYTYYLRAVDPAGNYFKTDKVSIIPKKIKVTATVNLQKDQEVTTENFNLKINTDKNSDVKIILKNNKKVIFEKEFKNISDSDLNVNLLLEKGINEVYLHVKDEFSNEFDQSYFITYNPLTLKTDIAEDVIESTKTNQGSDENLLENNNNRNDLNSNAIKAEQNLSNSTTTTQVENESSSWLWLIIFLILLAVFIWFFVINEDKLKERHANFKKRKSNFAIFRGSDSKLNRDLDKIKKEREKKQIARRLEEQRKKKLEQKPRSELEKKKLEDLSNRREISIPFEQRKKAKRRVEKIKREDDYENSLNKKEDKTKSSLKEKLMNKYSKKKKEDAMLSYLERIKNRGPKPETVFTEEKKDIVDKNNDSTKTHEGPEISAENPVEEKTNKKESFKLSLDDYLSRKTKKKRFYFAEKEVERDLKNRN